MPFSSSKAFVYLLKGGHFLKLVHMQAFRPGGRQASQQGERKEQIDRQMDRQTEGQTDREADRDTGRHTDRQAGRLKDRQTGGQTRGWTDRQDRQLAGQSHRAGQSGAHLSAAFTKQSSAVTKSNTRTASMPSCGCTTTGATKPPSWTWLEYFIEF